MSAIDNLENRLTSPYAKGATSNNYKLLKTAGDECDEASTVIANIKSAHFVDEAAGKNLENLAVLLQTPRTTGETDAHYRARLKTMWQRFVGSSTIQDIKNVTAAQLSVSTTRVNVKEDFTSKYAHFDVWVWLTDLIAAGITVDELKTMLGNIKGAGISLSTFQYGTFAPRGISDPNDATKAYNDIANSNPGGGTYAGLL